MCHFENLVKRRHQLSSCLSLHRPRAQLRALPCHLATLLLESVVVTVVQLQGPAEERELLITKILRIEEKNQFDPFLEKSYHFGEESIIGQM